MIDTKKLREELNGYFVPPLRVRTIELLDELDRVKAERDTLKVDAERYRFLRAQQIDGEPGQPVIAMPNGMRSGYYLNEETADFAVDAAIRASKGGA